jgi:uncharacterized integral membrane protein
MIRFIRLVVLTVVAIVLLLFAFANRQFVTVSFDPFGSPDNPAIATTAPLFAVVIASAMLGVIAGAAATWLSQGRHRRAARHHRAEAQKWRAEAEALRGAHQPDALPRS